MISIVVHAAVARSCPRPRRLPLIEYRLGVVGILLIDLVQQVLYKSRRKRLLTGAHKHVIVPEKVRYALHPLSLDRIQLSYFVILPLGQPERVRYVADELFKAVQALSVQQDADFLARLLGGANNRDQPRLRPHFGGGGRCSCRMLTVVVGVVGIVV